MYILFKTIMFGVLAYLAVAIVVPSMSFWVELGNVVSAPFIFFCQMVPTFIFTGIQNLSELIDAFAVSTPGAGYLEWLALLVSFIALFATLAYYVLLFVAFVMVLNRLSDKVHYASSTPEERMREAEIDAAYNNSPQRANEVSNDAFWENQKLNFFGLTTNAEIIKGDVQANAIVQALNKTR